MSEKPDFINMTPEEIRAWWNTPEGKVLSKQIQDNLDAARLVTRKMEHARNNNLRCTCCPVHKRLR